MAHLTTCVWSLRKTGSKPTRESEDGVATTEATFTSRSSANRALSRLPTHVPWHPTPIKPRGQLNGRNKCPSMALSLKSSCVVLNKIKSLGRDSCKHHQATNALFTINIIFKEWQPLRLDIPIIEEAQIASYIWYSNKEIIYLTNKSK